VTSKFDFSRINRGGIITNNIWQNYHLQALTCWISLGTVSTERTEYCILHTTHLQNTYRKRKVIHSQTFTVSLQFQCVQSLLLIGAA